MSKTPTAYTAALTHFTDHAAAIAEVEQIKRAADAVEARLTAAADTAKPDFAAISRLHSERGHLATRLHRAAATVAHLEATFEKPGYALYNEANAARSRAEDAAVDCVHARLRDDFTGPTLERVARLHPLLASEAGRAANAASPQDYTTFAAFSPHVPIIVRLIAQAEARAAIYAKHTASRTLPSQSALDAVSPDAAKPYVMVPRRELTPAEEAEQLRKLTSDENHRLQALYNEGRAIAGDYNENADALAVFISRHPEVARFFPIRRTA